MIAFQTAEEGCCKVHVEYFTTSSHNGQIMAYLLQISVSSPSQAVQHDVWQYMVCELVPHQHGQYTVWTAIGVMATNTEGED